MSETKWSHKVSSPELATMLMFSFRYALGRQSTAPSAVQDLLASYGHVLQTWQKEQIIKDIQTAIAGDYAGADCDVATWRAVIETMKGKP
jgi:hypothetical protein